MYSAKSDHKQRRRPRAAAPLTIVETPTDELATTAIN
jgi:hypothetical protein